VGNTTAGAPFVLVDGLPAPVQVSLTDRAGWAVCAIGPAAGRAFGCDLELVEPRSGGFQEDFFTDTERWFVAELADDEARAVTANVFWSAKESTLKVLRTGLSRDPRSLAVSLDLATGSSPVSGPVVAGSFRHHGAGAATGWSALTVHDRDGGTFAGWWRHDGPFVLTMVAARPGPWPRMLAGSTPLGAPGDSWVDHPLWSALDTP